MVTWFLEPPSISSHTPARLKLIVAATIQINTVVVVRTSLSTLVYGPEYH